MFRKFKKELSDSVYIIDGARTAMGNPYGSLKKFTAPQLAAVVINEIVRSNKVNKNEIDEVILGNVVAAGAGQNLARQAAVLAGLPPEIPSPP